MIRQILPILTGLLVAVSAIAADKKKAAADPAAREQMLRVQIFLDKANFGPGKIDARDGEFTQKALTRYRAAKGQQPTAPAPTPDSGGPAEGGAPAAPAPSGGATSANARGDKSSESDFSDLDLASIDPLYVDYTVTEDDVKATGELPKEREAQSKLKWLPYTSVLEGVAERFHSDIDYLKELNPNIGEDLKPG